MGDDHELFQEMVALLRSDAPRWQSALAAAARECDLPRLQRAAHTLKGLAANFGANRTVAAAAEVEKLARTHQSEGLQRALTELEEALSELLAALSSPFKSSPAPR